MSNQEKYDQFILLWFQLSLYGSVYPRISSGPWPVPYSVPRLVRIMCLWLKISQLAHLLKLDTLTSTAKQFRLSPGSIQPSDFWKLKLCYCLWWKVWRKTLLANNPSPKISYWGHLFTLYANSNHWFWIEQGMTITKGPFVPRIRGVQSQQA